MARHYIDSLLSEREKIIMTAHQHWFMLASSIFVEIVLIFIIFIITVFAAFNAGKTIPIPLLVVLLIGLIMMLLPIFSMIRDILIFANREYIVTNRRVIQIAGVYNKSVTDSSLEKVNDVKLTQSIIGRLFDFGDVEILTASELGANLFRRIEKPIKFKTAMLNAKEQLEMLPMMEGRSDDIPTLITGLDKLRQQGILSEAEFQQKKAELLAKL